MSLPERETDLYGPIRELLTAQGFEVRAEVNHCDVTAVKGEDLVVVEMKRRFTVDLVAQAVERQSRADSVYVAVPGPVDRRKNRKWRGRIRLLRRLGIGLIVVFHHLGAPRVEIICHPMDYRPHKYKKKRRALLQEIAFRSGDYNTGGSVRRKLVTAYRENAIFIACCLQAHGAMTPKRLREFGTGEKTQSILSQNHYGWFQRVERGVYVLNAQGALELKSYPELTARYGKKITKAGRSMGGE